MKNLLTLTIFLTACGSDIQSKNPQNVVNNGTNNNSTNNSTSNHTANNNGTTNSQTNNDTIMADCGNGILDTTEACEGFELRNKTCESEGFSSGDLMCSRTCKLDTTNCKKCGDGVVDGGEDCDGDALGTATCQSLNQNTYGPGLSCANCSFNTQNCGELLGNCRELGPCRLDCGTDETCQKTCDDRAPQKVIDALDAYSECVQINNCTDLQCEEGNCLDEIGACRRLL